MASGADPVQRNIWNILAIFDNGIVSIFSKEALRLAEERIGSHGVFLLGNFLELGLQDDFFDCSVSLHTIYHIDRDKQEEEAVRKLLSVTKPGRPVVIVYSNPDAFRLLKRLGFPLRFARRVMNKLRRTFRSPSHSSASAGPSHLSRGICWTRPLFLRTSSRLVAEVSSRCRCQSASVAFVWVRSAKTVFPRQ